MSSPAVKVQGPKRAIAICADDYGVDQNVDRAIVDLAMQGRLTATSVLVDAAIDPESIRALDQVNMDVGLHLNFSEVLGELSVDAVMPLSHLIVRSHARLLSRQWVRASIERQLSRFKVLLGRSPNYVDGHLHVHQLPVIRDELLQALGAQALPPGFWLRDTRAGDLSGSPWAEQFKSWVVSHLGMGTLVAMAAGQRIGLNHGFFGVYDFTAEHRPFMQMMAGWLAKANAGSLVMTHPSCQALPGDPIGAARVIEYQALGSQVFGELLEKEAITLVRPSQVLSSLP